MKHLSSTLIFVLLQLTVGIIPAIQTLKRQSFARKRIITSVLNPVHTTRSQAVFTSRKHGCGQVPVFTACEHGWCVPAFKQTDLNPMYTGLGRGLAAAILALDLVSVLRVRS